MAITTVTVTTKFTEWKDITNDIITKLGDNDLLSTTVKTSLVAAINEIYTLSGDLGTLSTTDQSSLVAAINEVLTEMGDIANLNTTATEVVAAVNELLLAIGDITGLTTTVTTNLTVALNSVKSELGDLTSLTTTAQGSAVAAINELDGDIGDLTSLTTTAQGSAVDAINELDGEIGDLTSLNTTAQADLVAALNEVETETVKIEESQYTNQEPNGGRFASDNLSTIAVATFDAASGLLIADNTAVFTQGQNFINDNSNYGGAGGSLGTDISTLVTALQTKAGRTELRYGYEFYILDVTAGAGTQDGDTYTAINYYPIVENNNVMLGPIGGIMTWMAWVRLKTLNTPANNGIVIGHSGGSYSNWIDDVASTDQHLLTVGDGWVHVRQTFTLTKEFEQFFPAIYANDSDVVQIALPVLIPAGAELGMHQGLVN